MSSRTLMFLFLIMIFPVLEGQDYPGGDEISAFEQFDRLYGMDQNLVNGVRYIPSYPGAKGHPFLTEDNFQEGSLQIGEDYFEDVVLAYDIHDQNLLLRYTHQTGTPIQIILRKKRIQSFTLGNRKFERMKLDDMDSKIYQVLGAGRNRFCIYWYKSLVQSATGTNFYVFSQSKRNLFLFRDGNAQPFKSRGSFIKMFDPGQKKAIKSYFRETRINLKTATDHQLEGLLNFCNDLPGER